MSPPRFDVFLACTPATRENVDLIADELDRRGLTHWTVAIDPGSKIAGREMVPEALQLCRTCAVFVGNRVDSPLRDKTFREALLKWLNGDGGRRAFPVVLPGLAATDFKRVHPSAIWLTNGIADREAIDSLCAAIRTRPIRVFLCHASDDKGEVRKLHSWLTEHGFLPWLDERDLVPGQDWHEAIKSAVRATDVVLICLSPTAVGKSGYVQKELREALDVADEQPFGAIFLIPTKLAECDVPLHLQHLQWVELYKDGGHDALLAALRLKAASGRLGGPNLPPIQDTGELYEWDRSSTILLIDDNPDLLRFLERLLSEEWTVLTADSATNARTIATGKPLAAIVADFLLPDGNGIGLIADLIESNPRAVPLLMTGTILSKEEAARCEENAIAVLRKPFLASDLARMISTRTGRK